MKILTSFIARFRHHEYTAGNIRPALAAQMETWLQDPQPRLRRIALAFFRGVAREKAMAQTPIPKVLYTLAKDDYRSVRRDVVTTLAAIDSAKAVTTLQAILNDADADIRAAAGKALRTDRDRPADQL